MDGWDHGHILSVDEDRMLGYDNQSNIEIARHMVPLSVMSV
jgi:hypothetical protein